MRVGEGTFSEDYVRCVKYSQRMVGLPGGSNTRIQRCLLPWLSIYVSLYHQNNLKMFAHRFKGIV